MNTETVLADIVASVTEILKETVNQAGEDMKQPTLYTLEEQTHAALLRIGQVIVQGLVAGQGSGLVGSTRPCGCGAQQTYHDQAHPLQVMTSLGKVCLEQRAWYQCASCGASSYPLDEQVGLAPVGRMSRYLQEQCGWLLAVLPTRLAQQALARFGWPVVAASQVREHGEALGAELEEYLQDRLACAQREAGDLPAKAPSPRQPPSAERLYAAPDGVMYCTTEREEETGKVRWRELKVAAVYEATPAKAMPEPAQEAAPVQLPVRTRIRRWLGEEAPDLPVAPPDQAVRVTYVAETGPWEHLGPRLWGELWERGLLRSVQDLVVVADGSDHIDQVVDNDLRVPGIHVTRILDIAHAQQHLWAVSKGAFGEGNTAGVTWVQPLLTSLEHGAVDEIVASLEALRAGRAAMRPEVAELARKAAGYFQQRREQVRYPHFVAAGYQIGSGLAESACKRFGTDRMKGAGMRWTVHGAQCVATLRMFVLSERWGEVSDYCRKAA
jgi:hypothetical protein